MTTYYLTTPLKTSDVTQLQVGDMVYLSGVIYTSRDMGHLRMATLLEAGKPLPVNLEESVIFHAGPVAIKNGDNWNLSVIGPTTSIRMEPYAKMMAKLGVKAIIGKGGLAKESLITFHRFKQAYLQAPPGCAVKLAETVKGIREVHWLDLGLPEALWVMEVETFGPLIVSMDCNEMSLYTQIKDKAYQIIGDFFSSPETPA